MNDELTQLLGRIISGEVTDENIKGIFCPNQWPDFSA